MKPAALIKKAVRALDLGLVGLRLFSLVLFRLGLAGSHQPLPLSAALPPPWLGGWTNAPGGAEKGSPVMVSVESAAMSQRIAVMHPCG